MNQNSQNPKSLIKSGTPPPWKVDPQEIFGSQETDNYMEEKNSQEFNYTPSSKKKGK